MKYRTNLLRLFLCAAFAFLLSADVARGQNSIAFTPNGFSGWPDTAYAGQNVPVGGFLKNYSTDSVFQDSFRVDGYVDTGAAFVYFSMPFYNLYGNFSLPPLDSGFLILPIDFDLGNMGGNFHVGNNVVVVWPFATGGDFVTGDSVTVNVFIIDTTSSIHEHPEGDVRIYPVPASGPLVISSHHPVYQVTSVVIYDALGQVVYRSLPNSSASPIDTETWAPGLYTIETTLSNGSVGYYKILRQ